MEDPNKNNNNNNINEIKEECPKDPSQKGYAKKCEGCPYRQQCQSQNKNSGQGGSFGIPSEESQLFKTKLKSIKNIILVLSGKGGVGKSTLSSQIALGLSKNQSLQIGLLDVDICGPSIPRMMGLENEEIRQTPQGWEPVYKEQNLAIMSIGYLLKDKKSAVIWRGPRKNGLIKEFLVGVNWENLDYLVIDTPPGTSDEHLSLVAYLKETNLMGAVLVTTPQEVAIMDVRKEVNFCQKAGVKIIGVVENMAGFVCPHCNKKSDIFEANTGGADGLCKEFGIKLIGRLPIEPKIMQSTEKGVYFPDVFQESESAKEIQNIVKIIMEMK